MQLPLQLPLSSEFDYVAHATHGTKKKEKKRKGKKENKKLNNRFTLVPRLLSCSSSASELKSIFLLEDELKCDLSPAPLSFFYSSCSHPPPLEIFQFITLPASPQALPPSQLCRPAVNLARQLETTECVLSFRSCGLTCQ